MIIIQKARYLLAIVSALFCVLSGPVSAQQFETNILTGGPTGTYIQFGNDISSAAASCGLELKVRESAGSLENFLGVRKRRHTQFGIVQSDVLEYLNTFASDDPSIARAIQGVRIAFPLYNEEVHILARRDIGTLQELTDKKIAIGTENSGTFLTASLVIDLGQISPAETLTINAQESLAALLAGEIDAFFYVAGAPARIFEDPEIDAAQFHLLPIDDPTLQAVYLPAEIPAGSYPFQAEATPVVAVKAVLMTYEYNPRRNAYHRLSCEAVSDVAHVITSRFSELSETGHPKWQQVDLSDIPPGWNIGNCVNIGIDPEYPLACDWDVVEPAPVQSEPESSANAAYRKQICAAIGC